MRLFYDGSQNKKINIQVFDFKPYQTWKQLFKKEKGKN